MAAEFVDYKRGPGFWFHFQIAIASDICEHPLLSAKYTDFMVGKEEDIFGMLDRGLNAYERIYRYHKSIMEW